MTADELAFRHRGRRSVARDRGRPAAPANSRGSACPAPSAWRIADLFGRGMPSALSQAHRRKVFVAADERGADEAATLARLLGYDNVAVLEGGFGAASGPRSSTPRPPPGEGRDDTPGLPRRRRSPDCRAHEGPRHDRRGRAEAEEDRRRLRRVGRLMMTDRVRAGDERGSRRLRGVPRRRAGLRGHRRDRSPAAGRVLEARSIRPRLRGLHGQRPLRRVAGAAPRRAARRRRVRQSRTRSTRRRRPAPRPWSAAGTACSRSSGRIRASTAWSSPPTPARR